MFVVTNRVPVAAGYEDLFEQRFRKRAGQIDKQPGFVRMRILKPVSEQTPYVVETTWASEQAFHDWVQSADFKTAHQNPMPKEAFTPGGGLEQFEVIISAEAP
ncbi:MAG: antibiotic biosynthesis monooxygenase [Gammaproteobacteria bacterium]|nr:antibiotic biosynthesis monooxygenase [Gammaproteobacteria bacterium]